MPAQYDFKENPNSKGDGEKQPLHPRIVSPKTSHRNLILLIYFKLIINSTCSFIRWHCTNDATMPYLYSLRTEKQKVRQ